MHLGLEADGKGCADATRGPCPRNPVRIHAIVLFPAPGLFPEPPLQRYHALDIRTLLGAEDGGCSGRSRQRNVGIVESLDPDMGGQGREDLQETGSAVHDRRPSKAGPDFFDSLFYRILHHLTCTDG